MSVPAPIGGGGYSGSGGSRLTGHPTTRIKKPSSNVVRTPLRPVYRAPMRRTAPVYNSGGGGGVSRAPRSTPTGSPGKIQPVKKPMSLTDWLTKDSEYQNQLRQFGKTWSSFIADLGVRKGRVGQDYQLGQKQMATQKERDLKSMQDDFASRGMLQSGLYGDRLGKYEQDFQTNLTGLGRQNSQLLQDIATEQGNFKREQDLEKERARAAAAKRRTTTV